MLQYIYLMGTLIFISILEKVGIQTNLKVSWLVGLYLASLCKKMDPLRHEDSTNVHAADAWDIRRRREVLARIYRGSAQRCGALLHASAWHQREGGKAAPRVRVHQRSNRQDTTRTAARPPSLSRREALPRRTEQVWGLQALQVILVESNSSWELRIESNSRWELRVESYDYLFSNIF